MSDARFEAHPNPSTYLVRELIGNMADAGFSKQDLKIDEWIRQWMELNKRVMNKNDEWEDQLAGRPAAVIDAMKLNDMKYHALIWNP